MPALPKLSGPRLAPASGGPARHLVVLLHGVGSDGNDLIGLAPHLAPALPDAAFVSPDAPFPYDMAPVGHQWFSLADRTPAMLEAGIAATAPILDAFVDEQLAALGLAGDRLALVGFSQGAMMALYVGARRPVAPAALVAYSGALLAPGGLVAAPSRPPVLLVHGAEDPVVPVQAMEAADAALSAAGFPVQALRRPGLAHGIDEAGLVEGARFLRSTLQG